MILIFIGIRISRLSPISRKINSTSLKLLIEHLWWTLTKRLVKQKSTPTITLRKLIDVRETSSKFEGSAEMIAIRNGR
jgi:hypothetical protein